MKIFRLLENIFNFLKILRISSVLTLLPESQKQSSHFDKCNALKQIWKMKQCGKQWISFYEQDPQISLYVKINVRDKKNSILFFILTQIFHPDGSMWKINIFIGNDSCYTFTQWDLSEHLFSLSDLLNVSQQHDL